LYDPGWQQRHVRGGRWRSEAGRQVAAPVPLGTMRAARSCLHKLHGGARIKLVALYINDCNPCSTGVGGRAGTAAKKVTLGTRERAGSLGVKWSAQRLKRMPHTEGPGAHHSPRTPGGWAEAGRLPAGGGAGRAEQRAATTAMHPRMRAVRVLRDQRMMHRCTQHYSTPGGRAEWATRTQGGLVAPAAGQLPAGWLGRPGALSPHSSPIA
jgi:hypothetical protein